MIGLYSHIPLKTSRPTREQPCNLDRLETRDTDIRLDEGPISIDAGPAMMIQWLNQTDFSIDCRRIPRKVMKAIRIVPIIRFSDIAPTSPSPY